MLINRDFRRMLLATVISDTGSGIHGALITIWIVGTLLSGNENAPIVTSVVSSIGLGAGIFANLISGVLVDRWNKWRTMLRADVIMAIATTVIVLLTLVHPLIDNPWTIVGVIVVASAVINGAAPFFTSSRFVITNDLVPERLYGRAFGYMHNAEASGELVGPPLASIIIVSLGASVGFGIDATTFLCSALLVYAVWRRNPGTGNAPTVQKQDRSFRSDYIEGFKEIGRNPKVSLVLTALFAVGVGGAMFLRVEIFFLQDEAGLSPNWYGISMGVFAAGLLLGAWLGGRVIDKIDAVKMLVLTMAAYGALVLVFAYFSNLVVILLFKLLLGSLAAALDVSVGPLVMRTVQKECLGRVIAAFRTINAAGWMLGTMIGGVLAGPILSGVAMEVLGLEVGRFQIIFGIAGGLCCATALVTSVISKNQTKIPERAALYITIFGWCHRYKGEQLAMARGVPSVLRLKPADFP